jgi:DNA-binding NarL/FixJ family response regulator
MRTVRRNQYYASPKIADLVIGEYTRQLAADERSSRPQLSPREREVLQLLAEGHRTKEIAERLHVSAGTVDTHRSHIMEKLGIDNLADLVKYAIREGLTSLDNA